MSKTSKVESHWYCLIGIGIAFGVLAGAPAGAQSAVADSEPPIISVKLSLADAIALARQDNIALAQSRDDIAAAKAGAARAESALQPGISATSFGTTGTESSVTGSSPGVAPGSFLSAPRNPFVDENLTVMVPLFTGGELAAKIGAAVALARAGESGYSTQTLATLESVTEAYVGTLLADAQVKSAQSRLDAEDEQVRISRAKVAGGSLAPVDLLREQAEEADARSELTEDQASADVAMVALKADLGVSQSSDIVLTDTLDSLASGATARMPSTLAAAMASADSSRPEIAAATARLKSVQSDLNAARGEYAPQVYGVGMADETSGKGLRGTAGYTVGLTASIPLYDGGARKADVDQAKAALDRANLDVELARQSVEQDVAQAWYELQSGQQQVSSAEAGVAAAEQGYSLADLRYSAGKSTTAERLDALAAQTRAQSDLAQAQAGLIVARSRLMAAMGLGLVSNGQ